MKVFWKLAALSAVAAITLLPSSTFAENEDQNTVEWPSIVGVITAQGVNNPVSHNINSGTFAWSARSGHARINLETGRAYFEVEGLVINGTSFSGTPGPITAVTGTLVCNAGTNTESTHDTPAVALSGRGNARFSGHLANGPIECGNPLFLIRIAVPEGAAGRWIATGAQRSFSDSD
jgi:hypothetical protein